MRTLLEDLRYGLRMLLKSPGFTVVVVLILALGIGANSAIFSVVNAVVLRPLPYRDPDRLYQLSGMKASGSRWISAPDFLTWQKRTQVFEQMAAARQLSFTLSQVDEPEQVHALSVTRECLPMLGTPPLLGRLFAEDDFRPGAPRVVLLGHQLWRRRFGSDPQILGKPVTLDGEAYTVAGVMPPAFQFNRRLFELWAPLTFTAEHLGRRDWPAFMVFGRLKPGVTRQQADTEMDTLSGALRQEFPETHKDWRAVLASLQEEVAAESRTTLLLLLGAVGFVLLIACMNVANMLLARSWGRAKEIAIRSALGARRLRVIRQLLTESLLLAGLGGALGLLLAAWGGPALARLFPGSLPRLDQTSLDVYVLAFTLLLSVLSGVLFGLAPALQVSRVDLNETLKETGRSGAGGWRGHRLRTLLVVAETALSLVLLVGAGLMIRSFVRLLQVNPGFKAERILTVRLPLPTYRVRDRKKQPAYYTEILEQVQTLPGVQSAALVTILPLGGISTVMTFARTGEEADEKGWTVPFRSISPEYFRVMRIPVLMGRPFNESDREGAPQVAIINEALARRMWPGENPIGKSLPAGGFLPVVGVVGNVKYGSLMAEPRPELYLPYLQRLGVPQSALVIRTASDPSKLTASVRKRIRELHSDQPVNEVRTMEELIANSVSRPRFYTVLLGVFGGLALLLAAAGVYGVMSYSVSQRHHEIGIRMALGARPTDVLKLVVSQGARYVVIGVAIGLGGAFAATRLLASLLYGITPTDPPTFAVISLLLLAVALAAIYVPAHRASRVDPMVALRHE